MPSPTSLFIVAFTTALIAVQSPYGMARADDEARPAIQAFAAQPSTVTDQRRTGGSNLSSASNTAGGYKQQRPDISSEIDLATGDGQQRSVSEKPADCVGGQPVCRLTGHPE